MFYQNTKTIDELNTCLSKQKKEVEGLKKSPEVIIEGVSNY